MTTRAVCVVINADDTENLARFWSAALAWPVTPENSGAVTISPPTDDPAQAGQLPLTFVQTSELKTAKNRVHLDLASRSTEHQAALVSRLEALGARQIDIGQRNVTW